MTDKKKHSSSYDNRRVNSVSYGSGKKKKKKKKKHFFSKRTRKMLRRNKFKIFLAVYTLILIILGAVFLGYTDKCLIEYENSQSVHVAEEFFNNFSECVAAGNLPSDIDMAEFAGPFDSIDSVKDVFMSTIAGKQLSFRKAPDSYNTENPKYQILADEQPVLEYSYTATNSRPIFGILTIMDWNIESIKPVMSTSGSGIVIDVPSTYTVTINGVTLDDSYANPEADDYEIFQYASEYITLPSKKEYIVNDLKFDPLIVVTDEAGNPVECTVEGNVYSAGFTSSDEVPSEYYDLALESAKTWSLFMSTDLSGPSYGLATAQQVVVKDSYYYDLAASYAGSVDITFTSAHTLDPETFTEVVVDEYTRYSDNCFSCHIHFIKNMTLTRNGNKASDETDSTFMFIYYDDSDDGQDNPHWAIVDMVANTEN